MSHVLRQRFVVIAAMAIVLASANIAAAADNPGQADLDKAMKLKITASTLKDLGEVIRLCESATSKGLDKQNIPFAKDLLAATLVTRGTAYANRAFQLQARQGAWRPERINGLADLERGLQLNPKQPQAWYLIARLDLLPGGDARAAVKALDQTIAQSEDEPPLRAEALVLRSAAESDPQKQMADLDEAIRVAPGDAAVFRARGLARAQADHLDAAIEDLDKAIQLDSRQLGTYEIKALVLVKQKRVAEALAVLEQARLLAPRSMELPFTKAKIYESRGDYQAALQELSRTLAIDASNPKVLAFRAKVYEEMGDKKNALADVDKILKLQPQEPSMMRARAELLFGIGKLDDAAAEFEALRRANPADEHTLMQLGVLYSAEKKLDKAMEAFSAVIAISPQQWQAYRDRGDALLGLGRRAEAVADYDASLRLRPNEPLTLNNLAWLLATAPDDKLRDGKRALSLALEACRLTEYKQDYILSTLAAAYAETGDFDNAKKWSAKAIETATKENADALKKELESYKGGKAWRDK